MPYRPRIVDPELAARLAATGAVVIEGPKGCGKTATARQVARSEVLLDVDENARRAIAIDPSLVLDGPVPRLFDEWQLEPTLWNHLRRAVDARQQPGQFILTGSQQLGLLQAVSQTLAGGTGLRSPATVVLPSSDTSYEVTE